MNIVEIAAENFPQYVQAGLYKNCKKIYPKLPQDISEVDGAGDFCDYVFNHVGR